MARGLVWMLSMRESMLELLEIMHLQYVPVHGVDIKSVRCNEIGKDIRVKTLPRGWCIYSGFVGTGFILSVWMKLLRGVSY